MVRTDCITNFINTYNNTLFRFYQHNNLICRENIFSYFLHIFSRKMIFLAMLMGILGMVMLLVMCTDILPGSY